MEQMPKKKRKIKDFLIYLPAFISVLVLIGVSPQKLVPSGTWSPAPDGT